jgi:RNA polymerase sigma-70 factor (ECF subfamily)
MPSHDSFLPLFLAAQPDLRAFIAAMVRDPAAREDIFQEVSMVLWKSFPKYDSSRPFGAWARGIAALKIKEDHRYRSRLPDSIAPEVIEAVATGFDSEQGTGWQKQERALLTCMEELPPRSSQLITRRYAGSVSIEDLAEHMGMSVDAIYQALSRLRRQLRDCVQRRVAQLSTLM